MPRNYTCMISLPRNYSLIGQFGTSIKFCSQEYCILFSLVVSTVSSQASKHFYSFAHYPHHTRSASIITYHSNTHCPHHLQQTWSTDINLIGSRVATRLPLPWGLCVSTDGQGCPESSSQVHHLSMCNILDFFLSNTLTQPEVFSFCCKR